MSQDQAGKARCSREALHAFLQILEAYHSLVLQQNAHFCSNTHKCCKNNILNKFIIFLQLGCLLLQT